MYCLDLATVLGILKLIQADYLLYYLIGVAALPLQEYANNLQDSGVHGAIVVLEPSFGADAMATALGIPPSRTMIRRHLADELNSLIEPAR